MVDQVEIKNQVETFSEEKKEENNSLKKEDYLNESIVS